MLKEIISLIECQISINGVDKKNLFQIDIIPDFGIVVKDNENEIDKYFFDNFNDFNEKVGFTSIFPYDAIHEFSIVQGACYSAGIPYHKTEKNKLTKAQLLIKKLFKL